MPPFCVQISWLTATGTLVLDIFLEVEFTDYQKLNINEIILSQKKILISDLPLYQILFKINKRKAKKRKNENKSL